MNHDALDPHVIDPALNTTTQAVHPLPTTLPSPKQPAFIMKESYYTGDPLTSEGSHSINEVTITMLGPR